MAWSHDSRRVTRTYVLAAYQRTAVSLDQLLPTASVPSVADALIEIRADGPVWAETAIYYAPLGPGVVPARAAVQMTCGDA